MIISKYNIYYCIVIQFTYIFSSLESLSLVQEVMAVSFFCTSSAKIASFGSLWLFQRLMFREFAFRDLNGVDVLLEWLRFLPVISMVSEFIMEGGRGLEFDFGYSVGVFCEWFWVERKECTWNHCNWECWRDKWTNECSCRGLNKERLYSKVGCGWGIVLHSKRWFELQISRIYLFPL